MKRRRLESKEDYEHEIQKLSRGSVNKHFDAFKDVDWDNPNFSIDPNDKRWILGSEVDLGNHPWYQSLPEEEQIRVGMYRYAHTVKVGSQFEQALITGIMSYNLNLPNNKPEFRYSMHEATEETHHIQMFQEFVNRSGIDTKGAPAWFRNLVPLAATIVARKAPVGFWVSVLAGEEPIDHMQKTVRREHPDIHPLLDNIMYNHIAEEARHISFAHIYLTRHIQRDRMNSAQRLALSVAFPVIMRSFADIIVKPGKDALKDMGIPQEVADEIWWDSPEGQENLRSLFPDARKLADNLGLRESRIGRAAWRAMGIN